jgi:hypothetical protein
MPGNLAAFVILPSMARKADAKAKFFPGFGHAPGQAESPCYLTLACEDAGYRPAKGCSWAIY